MTTRLLAPISDTTGTTLRLTLDTKRIVTGAVTDAQALAMGLFKTLQAADEDGEISGQELTVLTNLAKQNYMALSSLVMALRNGSVAE